VGKGRAGMEDGYGYCYTDSAVNLDSGFFAFFRGLISFR
jgi:hypothetical protein